tara:strand:- start:185 stop:553 length:369 start_codon:yes stop_codon:yes gene_type:complete
VEEVEPSSYLTGDGMLWVSVIMQGIHDAKLDFNDTEIHYSPNKRGANKYDITDSHGYKLSQARLNDYHNCLDARLWFEKQDDDFKLVCSLASLNINFVYNLYQEVLATEGIDPTEMLKRFMR